MSHFPVTKQLVAMVETVAPNGLPGVQVPCSMDIGGDGGATDSENNGYIEWEELWNGDQDEHGNEIYEISPVVYQPDSTGYRNNSGGTGGYAAYTDFNTDHNGIVGALGGAPEEQVCPLLPMTQRTPQFQPVLEVEQYGTVMTSDKAAVAVVVVFGAAIFNNTNAQVHL